MTQARLFRRRFFPDEIIELKDDIVLSFEDNILITRWNVLKPRKDIAYGVSAYFITQGFKVSKVYNHEDKLVYWYCDIIDTEMRLDEKKFIFNDLLIDVLIYPDGHTEVVDMDELADAMENRIIGDELTIKALRSANHLLKIIYSGKFSTLTRYIEDVEKAANRF